MKIIAKIEDRPPKFTLRLDMRLSQELDALCAEHGISKQELIEGILRKALADKNFTIIVKRKG